MTGYSCETRCASHAPVRAPRSPALLGHRNVLALTDAELVSVQEPEDRGANDGVVDITDARPNFLAELRDGRRTLRLKYGENGDLDPLDFLLVGGVEFRK